MSEYMFGLGGGWLGAKAEAIARKHGAELVNYIDSYCACGHGCNPHTCKMARRHWFATRNLGAPHDQQTADAVLGELEAKQ